jgi:hypothetical protein
MKGLMNSAGLYIEINQSGLKAFNGEKGLEVPLERRQDGRLTDSCKEKLAAGLQNFLQRKSWQPRVRATCAFGARGVSLRHITLPAAGREEFQRLLLMQIESEFPLPPDELAWGYRSCGESRSDGMTKRELLVMAVKKEVIEEYSELLSRCGINPVFTLAALARAGVCPQTAGTYGILDIGSHSSELVVFENGVPATVRVFPWGDENKTAADEVLDSVAKSMNGHWTGRKLFLTGRSADLTNILLPLASRLGSGVECELLKLASGEGRSAAVLGLKKLSEESGGQLLLFQTAQTDGKADLNHSASVKYAVLAAALAIALLLLPYAEAMAFKPWLAKKFSALNAQTNRLDTINREMNFLQFLKQGQPPYLDALYLFSKSAPSGSRIDSLTMNRRGEVSLRGSMRNSDQVSEFRTKLIDSGFFSNVSVEEQTPTPDHQKVNVRITAQWKPPGELQALAIGPTPEEIEKARTRKETPAGGMPPGFPPGGMMPGAMPVGFPAGVRPAGAIPAGAMPAGLQPGIQIHAGGAAKMAPARKEAKE